MPKFKPGDLVVWDHTLGALHAEGSILKPSALPEGAPVGEIVDYANDPQTWYVVAFHSVYHNHPMFEGASTTHPDTDKLTLTEDELVKVGEE